MQPSTVRGRTSIVSPNTQRRSDIQIIRRDTPAPYVALHRGPVDLAGVRSPLRASWRQVPVSQRYTPSGLSGASFLSGERPKNDETRLGRRAA